MATVALSDINHNGVTIPAGGKVVKRDFTDDEWAALEEAGAVGKEEKKATVEESTFEESTEGTVKEATP